MTKEITIQKSLILNTDQQTVWDFLTKKDKLALWFHPAKADLVEGEEFALVGKNDAGEMTNICWGSVLEMQVPTLLRYTFTIKPLGGSLTTVTWTLEDLGGATRLSLKHEGIEAAAGESYMNLLLALDNGWDKHLASMRDNATS